MLKIFHKERSVSILDLKVRSLVNSFILTVDTFEQFEKRFNEQLIKTEGMGEDFKKLYYVTRAEDKAQVWRRNITGGKDRLLMDIISITY